MVSTAPTNTIQGDYPACDVIKIELIFTDGWCNLSFNVSETKHVTQNLTADISITSKVLIDY